jgi:hypothetical protein
MNFLHGENEEKKDFIALPLSGFVPFVASV